MKIVLFFTIVIAILWSTYQVEPTLNTRLTHFRSGIYEVDIPSIYPAYWSFESSSTYTFSLSFFLPMVSAPQLIATLSSFSQFAPTRASIQLTANQPYPSTTTTGYFSASTSMGLQLMKLTICYLAYPSTVITSQFFIGRFEYYNSVIPANGEINQQSPSDQGLSNAHQMRELIFIHGFALSSTNGDLMIKPSITRNSSGIAKITLANILPVDIRLDFLGITVILSTSSNDLSRANVPWMQTIEVNTNGHFAVPFFGNTTTWFDQTKDSVFFVGLSYLVRQNGMSGQLAIDLNITNKIGVKNIFDIDFGISGLALPSKFCPPTHPYYADSCFAVCPGGYKTNEDLLTCTEYPSGSLAKGSTCEDYLNDVTTSIAPRNLQTCTSNEYLSSGSCIQPLTLLISSATTATLISPSGYYTENETIEEGVRPNIFGNGATFIKPNGLNNHPGNYEVTFRSDVILGSCSNLEAILTIAADDEFTATLNGVFVGNDVGWGNIKSYKITLNCL